MLNSVLVIIFLTCYVMQLVLETNPTILDSSSFSTFDLLCVLRDFAVNNYSSFHILNKITSDDFTPIITSSPTRKFKDFNSSVSINVLKNWSACMTVTDAMIESCSIPTTLPVTWTRVLKRFPKKNSSGVPCLIPRFYEFFGFIHASLAYGFGQVGFLSYANQINA